MNCTAQELSIISIALQIDPTGKPRTFMLEQHDRAIAIWKKMQEFTKEEEAVNPKTGNTEKVKVYTDGEIELTSEEKVFCLDLVNGMGWSVHDEAAQTIKQKLNK